MYGVCIKKSRSFSLLKVLSLWLKLEIFRGEKAYKPTYHLNLENPYNHVGCDISHLV